MIELPIRPNIHPYRGQTTLKKWLLHVGDLTVRVNSSLCHHNHSMPTACGGRTCGFCRVHFTEIFILSYQNAHHPLPPSVFGRGKAMTVNTSSPCSLSHRHGPAFPMPSCVPAFSLFIFIPSDRPNKREVSTRGLDIQQRENIFPFHLNLSPCNGYDKIA